MVISLNLRAAVYARMSTKMQDFSIDNQMLVINKYAQEREIPIIETYFDKGISGLTIKKRPALRRLIDTVVSGTASFNIIFVYDVSRWGRFQDIDESAYYEYICKKAGVSVHYVNEPFQNDETSLSSITKSVKRIMAAEYSRDLSKKIYLGKRNIASKGYQQGGVAGYGYRRAVLRDGKVTTILNYKDQKSLANDRVVLIPGPENEKIIVNRIYRYFIYKNYTPWKIANILNASGIQNDTNKEWNITKIINILKSERYIGNHIYGKLMQHLGVRKRNPPESWVRVEGTHEPLVSKRLFRLAQEKFAREKLKKHYSDDELLAFLRKLHQETGGVTYQKIREAKNHPPLYLYARRFGSLQAAHEAIGLLPLRPSVLGYRKALASVSLSVVTVLKKMLGDITIAPCTAFSTSRLILLRNRLRVYIIPCGASLGEAGYKSMRWLTKISKENSYDYALAIKMNAGNAGPIAYYLIPAYALGRSIAFPQEDCKLSPYRYKDMNTVGTALCYFTNH
jgi:DNA invertase Pin-like site-specific DNA recombinase